MDGTHFEEILLFFSLFLWMKIKTKKKKSESRGFVIFLEKGTKKEHITTLYKKCGWEILKCKIIKE